VNASLVSRCRISNQETSTYYIHTLFPLFPLFFFVILTLSLRRSHSFSSSFSLFLFVVLTLSLRCCPLLPIQIPSSDHVSEPSSTTVRRKARTAYSRNQKSKTPAHLDILLAYSILPPLHRHIPNANQSPHPELKCSTTSEEWAFHLLDFPRIAPPTSHTQLLSIINSR